MDKIKDFLKKLASSLQIMALYSDAHPRSKSAIDDTYNELRDVLKEYGDITIGIVGGEFVFEKEIFFELSNRLKYLAKDLSGKGIEKIIFKYGASREELSKFMNALTRRENELEDFTEYFSNLGLENINIGKIRVNDSSETGTLAYEDIDDYSYSLESVSKSFNSIFRGGTVDVFNMKKAMKSTLEMLLRGDWGLMMLTSVKRHDLFTFTHSLNVSALAMAFASELMFSKENILDIGIAGLFHDIGKIAISRKVIEKPGFLTDEEMVSVKSHTILGAEILIQQVDYIGILPVIVAFEHHLRYDLKGYPKLHYSRHPHFVSLIISLCDCYDALRSRRSYKRDYPPLMIYEIMFKERGRMFESSLFDKFFDFMGVYPISTIVQMNTGWIGIVREQNKGDRFSPKVEIVYPPKKKGVMVDLKKESKIEIKTSLNPFSSGKEYTSLI